MSDDVTAFLDDVQAQAEDHHLVPGAMVLPLVAALRTVLKEAGDWDAEAKRIDAKFAGEEDPWPRTVAGMRSQAFEQCAKALREAITRELQETPDGR